MLSAAGAAAQDDRLLTVADLVDRLQVKASYIYEHSTTWPFVRSQGRALRFSEREFNAWLAAGRLKRTK